MSYNCVDEKMHDGVYSVVIDAVCDVCKTRKQLFVPEKEWLVYNGGELIQRAIPSLGAADRELLISGTCDVCFSNLFSDEAGDEDGDAA
jgi:hypothetical protein